MFQQGDEMPERALELECDNKHVGPPTSSCKGNDCNLEATDYFRVLA